MKLLIVLLMAVSPLNAFAKKESFSEFVNQTIEQADRSFLEETNLSNVSISSREVWLHDVTRIRFRPIFGVEVPWLAKFEIKPTVELIWKKK